MAGNKSRIIYIELKTGQRDSGPARIGRVSFTRTGRTICYLGKRLQSLKGSGISANYFDIDTGEQYWISGPKQNGQDRHSAGSGSIHIDADVADEYWKEIRKCTPPSDPYLS
jgi:hypothetical protein